MKTKIYYDSTNKLQEIFNNEAIVVRINTKEWYIDAKYHEPTFKFSINTYYAFIKRKIFKIWEDLPKDCGGVSDFDIYEETTIHPEGLEIAANRLKQYTDEINEVEKEDFLCWYNEDDEYRIIIDNIELKNSLSKLADFIYESSKKKNKSIEFWF